MTKMQMQEEITIRDVRIHNDALRIERLKNQIKKLKAK